MRWSANSWIARFANPTLLEIFHRGKRVVSHVRNFTAYHHSTVREHMAKSHQAHLKRTLAVDSSGRERGRDSAQVMSARS